jgi:hypothetical protein
MNWQQMNVSNQLRQQRKETRALLDKIEILEDYCMEATTMLDVLGNTPPQVRDWIKKVRKYIDG